MTAEGNSLQYTQKDIQFLKEQDGQVYQSFYPSLSIRFVDNGGTPRDIFGSQNTLKYYEPLLLPVLVRFDDLNKVQDRYDLEEIPEAWAVFSTAIIEQSGHPATRVTIEPDVLIEKFADSEWRISKVFKTDYIGHNDNEFLHYECILERNTRTNVDLPEVKRNTNYWFGVGETGLLFCNEIETFDVNNDVVNNVFSFTAVDLFLYFAYPVEFGDLTDIQDAGNVSQIADWTKRTDVFNGETYNIYETNDAKTVTNEVLTFIF